VWKPGYWPLALYFSEFSFAFFAQSSQQTVVSLPSTVILMPSSWISQSHTGHFMVFIGSPFKLKWTRDPPPAFGGDAYEDILARPRTSGFQNLAHFAKSSATGMAHIRGGATELTAEGISKMAVAGEAQV